jgi:hypothetical protein
VRVRFESSVRKSESVRVTPQNRPMRLQRTTFGEKQGDGRISNGPAPPDERRRNRYSGVSRREEHADTRSPSHARPPTLAHLRPPALARQRSPASDRPLAGVLSWPSVAHVADHAAIGAMYFGGKNPAEFGREYDGSKLGHFSQLPRGRDLAGRKQADRDYNRSVHLSGQHYYCCLLKPCSSLNR